MPHDLVESKDGVFVGDVGSRLVFKFTSESKLSRDWLLGPVCVCVSHGHTHTRWAIGRRTLSCVFADRFSASVLLQSHIVLSRKEELMFKNLNVRQEQTGGGHASQ